MMNLDMVLRDSIFRQVYMQRFINKCGERHQKKFEKLLHDSRLNNKFEQQLLKHVIKC